MASTECFERVTGGVGSARRSGESAKVWRFTFNHRSAADNPKPVCASLLAGRVSDPNESSSFSLDQNEVFSYHRRFNRFDQFLACLCLRDVGLNADFFSLFNEVLVSV